MPPQNLDIERAAKVLVDSCFMTDAEAAKRHGVSRRTVISYRHRLDPAHETFTAELAQHFTVKLREAREVEGWADGLTETIRKAMSAVCECCDEMDKSDPRTLPALTEALRVLVDAQLALDILYARNGLSRTGQNQPVGEAGVAGAPGRGYA